MCSCAYSVSSPIGFFDSMLEPSAPKSERAPSLDLFSSGMSLPLFLTNSFSSLVLSLLAAQNFFLFFVWVTQRTQRKLRLLPLGFSMTHHPFSFKPFSVSFSDFFYSCLFLTLETMCKLVEMNCDEILILMLMLQTCSVLLPLPSRPLWAGWMVVQLWIWSGVGTEFLGGGSGAPGWGPFYCCIQQKWEIIFDLRVLK